VETALIFTGELALLHASEFKEPYPLFDLIYALTEIGIPIFVILLITATPIFAAES
jgi:hypothetical protein